MCKNKVKIYKSITAKNFNRHVMPRVLHHISVSTLLAPSLPFIKESIKNTAFHIPESNMA